MKYNATYDNKNIEKISKTTKKSMVKTNLWKTSQNIYKTHFNFRKHKPTPESLEDAIFDYLDECKKNDLIPTEIGFCLFTGLSRNALNKEPFTSEAYAEVIEKMRMIIEDMWIQKGLHTKNSVFHIFGMKNLFSEHWKDKKEIDENKTISINLVKFAQIEEPRNRNIIETSDAEIISENLISEISNQSNES